MTARSTLAAITLLLSPGLQAQDAFNSLDREDVAEDPIEAAIRAFENRDRDEANEVIVVLEDTAPDPADKPEATNDRGEPTGDTSAVLVTGRPPADSEVIDLSDIPVIPGDESVEEVATEPEPGLEVRVEKLQEGRGELDPDQVKLRAPFPAKPLDEAPAGWRIETSEEAPPFMRDVELLPGKNVTLTIRPHVLVPDADGVQQFAVAEPGFEASLGYQQSDTVSAVLSESIHQLDQGSAEIGHAIDRLQQLLVSLPKPDPAAEARSQAK